MDVQSECTCVISTQIKKQNMTRSPRMSFSGHYSAALRETTILTFNRISQGTLNLLVDRTTLQPIKPYQPHQPQLICDLLCLPSFVQYYIYEIVLFLALLHPCFKLVHFFLPSISIFGEFKQLKDNQQQFSMKQILG